MLTLLHTSLACALVALPGGSTPAPAGSSAPFSGRGPRAGTPSDTIPADTFADAGARDLFERARAASGLDLDGLTSWEATVRELTEIGLTADGIRRGRLLVRSDRAARIRWDAPRRQTLRWLDRTVEELAFGDDEESWSEPEDVEEIYFPIDPTLDRLGLASGDWVHPLSPQAGRFYRFASGDTTRVLLPDLGREVVLAELRFAPRRPAFELLGGSLWLDLETAALVRGAFRPARPWDLEAEEPEDWKDVPWFLKPVTAVIELMVVDYALYDLRWWLPARVHVEGVVRLGSALRLPFRGEAVASGVTINEPGLDPDFPLPPGWERRVVDPCEKARLAYAEQSERRARKRPDRPAADEPTDILELLCAGPVEPELVVLDPPSEVRTAWRTSPEGQTVSELPPAFERREISRLRDEVAATPFPPPPPPPARARLAAFRFNRVEGLSGGLLGSVPLSARSRVEAEARLGFADLVPNLRATWLKEGGTGRLDASAYWRLVASDDWATSFDLLSSVHAFLLGYDDGQYWRTAGASLGWRGGRGIRFEGRVFAEVQRDAPKETDVSVPHWIGGSEFPPNVKAVDVEAAGVSARIRVQSGADPRRPVFAATAWGEAATGSRSWGRLAAGGSAALPLFRPLALGVELSAGTTAGDVPSQRQYFLGGVETLRAFPGGAFAGTAFWLARAELATRSPSIRLVGFADLGWAGDRAAFRLDDPGLSVGVGVSALDGLLRLDVARSLHGRDPDAWRVYFFLDALL